MAAALTIHPKAGGAAVGAALGALIVAILSSINSIHLSAEAYAAIPAFLSTFGAWLAPAPTVAPAAAQVSDG